MDPKHAKLNQVSDLLLSPFTQYPVISLMDLIKYPNSILSLWDKQSTNSKQFYIDKLNHKYDDMLSSDNQCYCFHSTYWFGLDRQQSFQIKDVHGKRILNSQKAGIKSELAYETSQYYKKYYEKTFDITFFNIFGMDYFNHHKFKIVFIHRIGDYRKWSNIESVIQNCQNYFSNYSYDISSYLKELKWNTSTPKDITIECNIIIFEKLTHIEQIEAIKDTNILVGIHGSGLLNSIFMDDNSMILELIPHDGPSWVNPDHTLFHRFFKRTPLNHFSLPLSKSEQPINWNSEFSISFQRIKPCLEYMIQISMISLQGLKKKRSLTIKWIQDRIPHKLSKQTFKIQPKLK